MLPVKEEVSIVSPLMPPTETMMALASFLTLEVNWLQALPQSPSVKMITLLN
jgi:hypothetical protein